MTNVDNINKSLTKWNKEVTEVIERIRRISCSDECPMYDDCSQTVSECPERIIKWLLEETK